VSGHLIGCAGDVKDVGKSHKLALVAFADSADDRTHIAFPGYEGVMKWASCSRSRAAELISDLVAAGYIRLHKTSRPGRRAEYVVFPDGCCDLHRTPVEEPESAPTPADLVAALAAAGVDLTPEQAQRLATANGSEISDPSSGNRSEISDASDDESGNGSGNGSEISDASEQQVQNGSEISEHFTTSNTPPSPRKRGAIAPSNCQRHGTAPQPNCRGCGTTNRQLAAARAREGKRLADEADARRAAEFRARREQLAAQPPEVSGLLGETRRRIAESKTHTKARKKIGASR
jgi:hypothetical protein